MKVGTLMAQGAKCSYARLQFWLEAELLLTIKGIPLHTAFHFHLHNDCPDMKSTAEKDVNPPCTQKSLYYHQGNAIWDWQRPVLIVKCSYCLARKFTFRYQ